jgi:hypothetical protein
VTDAQDPSAVSEAPEAGAHRCDGTLTDLEAAKLLLDAWKFRQGHAWSSLTRYFFAAVLVSVIPYGLRDDLARRLRGVLLALPILGGLLALAAVWLYAAEYVRAQSMNRQFGKILQDYGYYARVDLRRMEGSCWLHELDGRPFMYLHCPPLSCLSGVNFIIVWSLVKLF